MFGPEPSFLYKKVAPVVFKSLSKKSVKLNSIFSKLYMERMKKSKTSTILSPFSSFHFDFICVFVVLWSSVSRIALEFLWVFVKCYGRSSFSFLRHCSPC